MKQKGAAWAKRLVPAAFVLMLALMLAGMVSVGRLKDGFDIDEFWTYGLSNAYERPFVVAPEGKWIGGDFFSSYLTVNGHAHEYLNVYQNQIADVHPPLYYLCIHALSSVFRDAGFTKWVGIGLNMACFAVTQCALFALSWLLLAGKRGEQAPTAGAYWGALVPPLLYGIGMGAVSSVLFIRMYAMMTMWTALLALVLVLLWQRGQTVWRMRALIAVLIAGFLTQYYFVIIACFLCAGYFAARLAKRQGAHAARFAGACMFALALAVGLFPWCLHHIFGGYRGVEAMERASGVQLSDMTRWCRILFDTLSAQQFGGALAWLAPLAAVLAAVPLGRIGKRGSLPAGSTAAALLGLAACGGYLAVIAVVSPYKVDRYIFCIYPLTVLAVYLLLAQGASRFGLRRGLACLLALGVMAANVSEFRPNYLYEGDSEYVRISEAHASLPCVVLGENDITQNLLDLAPFENVCVLSKDAADGVAPALAAQAAYDPAEGFVLFERYANDDTVRRIVEQTGAQGAQLLYTHQYRVFWVK